MVILGILHRFTSAPTSVSGDLNKGTSSLQGVTTPKDRINNCHIDRRILAFSVAQQSTSFTRTLCADRRGFWDHLRPKIFVKNVRHR
jgi:hypothetical protein